MEFAEKIILTPKKMLEVCRGLYEAGWQDCCNKHKHKPMFIQNEKQLKDYMLTIIKY